MFGALLGAVIGIFFGLAELFVGPVIGAVAGEFIAGKRMIDAGWAGWGSLRGNLGAMMGNCVSRPPYRDFLYPPCRHRFDALCPGEFRHVDIASMRSSATFNSLTPQS